MRKSVEKPRSQPSLKLFDLTAQSRLCNVKPLGTFPKATFLGDRDERYQMTKLGTLLHGAPTPELLWRAVGAVS